MSLAFSRSDDRLEQLTEAHFRGVLSDDEKAEFATLLDSSEESRKEFVQLAHFETALTRIYQIESPSTNDLSVFVAKKPWKLTQWAPWLVAAACLLFAFWPTATDSPLEDIVASSGVSSPGITALLVNQAGAKFSVARAPDDVGFGPGKYELDEGAVHLRFANGVDLVMEAPAKIEIRDLLRSRLHFGTVRAIVPPGAKGFTIATTDVDFEDIGTEFGLHVEQKTGVGSLHVFDGQVNVRRSKSNKLLTSVLGGQSVECRDGQPKSVDSLRPETFPTPDGIGFRRWRADTEELLRDPDLIAFFPFSSDAQKPSRLHNLKVGNQIVGDGRIDGARWVSGRWHGKEALLFDRDSDFAEFEVQGELEELTMAAWVYINRRDHPLTAIVDSNGWEDGDVHLQVNRHGYPYVDICETIPLHAGITRWDRPLVANGTWVHFATSISLPRQVARVYANGKLVVERPVRENGRLRPGACRIGNWLAVGEFAPVRSLNGRIDELAIWKRALSGEEISAEATRGRPSLLWPESTSL